MIMKIAGSNRRERVWIRKAAMCRSCRSTHGLRGRDGGYITLDTSDGAVRACKSCHGTGYAPVPECEFSQTAADFIKMKEQTIKRNSIGRYDGAIK